MGVHSPGLRKFAPAPGKSPEIPKWPGNSRILSRRGEQPHRGRRAVRGGLPRSRGSIRKFTRISVDDRQASEFRMVAGAVETRDRADDLPMGWRVGRQATRPIVIDPGCQGRQALHQGHAHPGRGDPASGRQRSEQRANPCGFFCQMCAALSADAGDRGGSQFRGFEFSLWYRSDRVTC